MNVKGVVGSSKDEWNVCCVVDAVHAFACIKSWGEMFFYRSAMNDSVPDWFYAANVIDK